MAQHLGLPGADLGFVVDLCADVALLDAIAIDYAKRAKALADEIIREMRADASSCSEESARGTQLTYCS
jgi:hypothetical protein